MKKLLFLLPAAILISCSPAEEKMSVRMADAVMSRYDSLGLYNVRTRMRWTYDLALLGMAIDRLGPVDSKYSDYMKAYMDHFVGADGSIETYRMNSYNIDMINPGRNLLTLYKRTGDEKYLRAIDTLVTQMENHPKTHSRGFWHKKIYPWQMWLDGIYMGSPFLTQYAAEFDQPQWFDTVAHQVTLIYEKTLDPETGLLYHAWDESREQRWSNPGTGQSPHFWSRATGWYMMALVDILDYFPEDHPQRGEMIQILQNISEAVLKVRDPESGSWYQVLDQGGREGNYLEGSGTAMFIYTYAKGAKKGVLDQSYYDIAEDAFSDMVDNFIQTDEDGMPSMVNICGGCGLGGNPYRDGSYEYYTTERIVKNDCKGVGPFILAAIELDK
ncbi:MAG: glycoside hydrolase family 88 protein [Bacteroidales bacterium]|nr:glycoside hydrolase family 88 protein [Bacteroidales bacterium]